MMPRACPVVLTFAAKDTDKRQFEDATRLSRGIDLDS